MKTITKNTNIIKKATAMAVLCLGLNQALNAQCSTSFTYNTTSSSISAISTSTGTTSLTGYSWSLLNSAGSGTGFSSNTSSFNASNLYNGTYVLNLDLDSITGTCTSASQTITISGGTNPPDCSSSFTYTVGASGLVNFTNTCPVDPLGNTNYTLDFEDGSGLYYSSALNPSYTYQANGTYYPTLEVSNLSGCYSISTQTIVIANNGNSCTNVLFKILRMS